MALTKLQYELERIALGDELRTLRRSKRVTGVTLAGRVKISQSKLSKFETGALVPPTDDLQAILLHLKATRADATRLTERARSLRTEFHSWRFQHRHGLAAKQIEIEELERKAKRIRVFQTGIIPGLLQSPSYARFVLNLANTTRQKDLDQAVSARIARQQILYDSGRQFEFVISEAAALSRFCDTETVVQQLDRIRLLFGLPNVKIGFISNRTPLSCVPLNGFVLYDSESVAVETMMGTVATVDRADVNSYVRIFGAFASAAEFGTDAEPFLDESKRLLTASSEASQKSRFHEYATK